MNIRDQTNDHDFIQQTFTKLALLDNITGIINEAENIRRSYAISPAKNYFDDIKNNKITCDSLLKLFRASSLDNQVQLTNAEVLKSLVTERFALFEESMEIQDRKGADSKFYKNIFDKGKVVNIDIKNQVIKIKNEEFNNLEKNKDKAEKSIQFTYLIFIIGISVSIVIFGAVFTAIYRKAARSIAEENSEITRKELEEIVKERTAEISKINQKLYAKVGELEKTESELKNSAEQYMRLFEQAHDAIIIFDPDSSKVINVNRRACDLYEFTKEEFLSLSLVSISKNIKQESENLKNTLEKGYYHNFQSVHYKKDMTEMLMEINASVFMYHGKKVILSINRDITNRILQLPA